MLGSFHKKMGGKRSDEDDVDYYDKTTHAICAHSLAADFVKEKQIKALNDFEK